MRIRTRRGKRVAALATLGCLTPLLVLTSAAASSPTAASAPVDARTATLTTHPPGLPDSGAAAARRITSAKVTQDLVHDRIKATITLRAVPTAATNAQVHVEFGNVVGGSCHGDVGAVSSTYSGLSAGFSRNRRTITLNKVVDEAGYMDWDCAFVATTVPDTTTSYDAVLGTLKDILAKPVLKISAVQLLRTNVKKVGLVRKVWTTLNVRMANTGRVAAPGTKLTGSGRGLKVKAVKVGKVYDDGHRLARIKVKLTGRKRTVLKLVARSGKVVATRTVVVKPVAAPKRPVAGAYKSKNGKVRFHIRKGRVVGFYTQQWTRCGTYPDFPTQSWVSYDFPRTAIARNGLVDARQNHRLFTAGLEMKVVGKRVSKGYFFYSGPNSCFASGKFTVKRVGG